jgi:hypothetical protein
MVQEDTSFFSKVWLYDLDGETWTHVATATEERAETSGIVDVSPWFGDGWWALDVQSHSNQTTLADQHYIHPVTGSDTTYTARRENGQLLLMHVPGS